MAREPQSSERIVDQKELLRAAVRRYERARFPAPAATLGPDGWIVSPGEPLRSGEPEHLPEAVDEMQAAILDALRTGEPLPLEMQRHLAVAFEYLQAGIAHLLLTPVRRPGGREAPILKHLQIDALRYLRWCEDGRISDSKPLSTVGTAFGVSTKTAGNWSRAWKGAALPPAPAHFGGPEVTEALKTSGAAYHRFRARAKP